MESILVFMLFKGLLALPELSSKTAYDATRGDIRNVFNLSNDHGDCKSNLIYSVLRHGSRNFGPSTVNKISIFLSKFSSLVNNGDIQLSEKVSWYKQWDQGSYFADYELVPEGMMEHYTIARRFKDRFPNLFPSYSISNYSVEATSKMRTIQSAMSFMYALLEATGPLGTSDSRLELNMTGYMPIGIVIRKDIENKLLRFVDTCPKYIRYMDTMQWKAEGIEFMSTKDIDDVVQSVSSSLNYDVTKEDIIAIYYLCAAEAMSPSQAGGSHFCDLFTPEDIGVLDFRKDLDKYYKYSYGFETNYKMSCLLLTDIINNLNNTNLQTPVLKFAHEETVLPLVSLLGLFDDGVILTHEMLNYSSRKMRGSRIVPFAGNIAFIRYSCPDDMHPKIQVIVNEREVQIPGCKDIGCTIDELYSILNTNSDGCDYDAICDISRKDDMSTTFELFFAFLLALLLCQSTYIFFHCYKHSQKNRDDVKISYNKIDDHAEPLIKAVDCDTPDSINSDNDEK